MCKTSEIKKKVLNLAEKSPKISSKTSFLLFFAYFLLYMTPGKYFFLDFECHVLCNFRPNFE